MKGRSELTPADKSSSTAEAQRMAIETYPLVLTNRETEEIRLFCDIARANGTHLSVKEAASLLHRDTSEEELVEAWNRAFALSGSYEIKSGLILPKGMNQAEALESHETERRQRATKNLAFAVQFAELDRTPQTRLVSVSGSYSYGSVAVGDDLDFFCITQTNSMWLFMTRSLILARVVSILKRDSPALCFSCVLDERFAWLEFDRRRDALFARDAMNAFVIHGSRFYNLLLRRNSWLSSYFPKLYKTKASENSQPSARQDGVDPSILIKTVNLFLFYTVGGYLKLKAKLGNRRLTKDGRLQLLFTAKIGKDHCIYESTRYRELRRLYAHLDRIVDANAIKATT